MSLRPSLLAIALFALCDVLILRAPAPGPSRRVSWKNALGMELVLLPRGAFWMGSPADEKDRGEDEEQHEAEISRAFYLGKYEVRQKEFRQVMGYNPSYFSREGKGKDGVDYGTQPRGGKDKIPWGEDPDDYPVEQVSWDEAVEYCRRLTDWDWKKPVGWEYRLPTEAEWEYACRAGGRTRYQNGDGAEDLNEAGWYYHNSGHRTHPVGKKEKNAWGLSDMHGNAWEWCADTYHDKYCNNSPPGPDEGLGRVIRGGSGNDLGGRCRSAARGWFTPGTRNWLVGFRVALSPPIKH